MHETKTLHILACFVCSAQCHRHKKGFQKRYHSTARPLLDVRVASVVPARCLGSWLAVNLEVGNVDRAQALAHKYTRFNPKTNNTFYMAINPGLFYSHFTPTLKATSCQPCDSEPASLTAIVKHQTSPNITCFYFERVLVLASAELFAGLDHSSIA
jgi:hypothetical protein